MSLSLKNKGFLIHNFIISLCILIYSLIWPNVCCLLRIAEIYFINAFYLKVLMIPGELGVQEMEHGEHGVLEMELGALGELEMALELGDLETELG
jgi:hypothetical protein